MSIPRVIRKYPNRRLYDTEESRYITLADVRDLVRQRVEFTVIDRRNGADITRSILLQVISDQERDGHAVMSSAFLERIIRSHDVVAQSLIAEHLEGSLKSFMESRDGAAGTGDFGPYSATSTGRDDDLEPRTADGVGTAG
jgi:polyhydroxyalkanoate synthesis repressor PhaR